MVRHPGWQQWLGHHPVPMVSQSAHAQAEGVAPGVELRSALEEWQDRRFSSADSPSRLTTGFLDGNNPVVDIYELKVGAPVPVPRPWVTELGLGSPFGARLLAWPKCLCSSWLYPKPCQRMCQAGQVRRCMRLQSPMLWPRPCLSRSDLWTVPVSGMSAQDKELSTCVSSSFPVPLCDTGQLTCLSY